MSEASVYRLLKAHDLIAGPAFIVMKAADEFKDKTTAANELWQTELHLSEGHWLGAACQGSGDAKASLDGRRRAGFTSRPSLTTSHP